MTTPNGDKPENSDPTTAEDEPSGGTVVASDELEAALREATEAVEARQAGRAAGGSASAHSPDKVLIEVLSGELQSLKKEYEGLAQEREELQDQSLRLRAEFENFRRRGLKERQEAHNFGHQNLVKELLPTVDNLERAVAHSAESAEGSGGEDLQALLQGIGLVQRELLGVLGRHGVVRIEASEQLFDPAVHEAMSQVVDDSVPPGSVVQVLEEGYQLRDRLLRPARVIVSISSAAAKPADSGEDES